MKHFAVLPLFAFAASALLLSGCGTPPPREFPYGQPKSKVATIPQAGQLFQSLFESFDEGAFLAAEQCGNPDGMEVDVKKSAITFRIRLYAKEGVYRKWAESQRELLADRNRMENTEPYKSIIPYISGESVMSNDMAKTEVFLLNHFAEQRPKDATPQYDRAALLFAMRSQDITRFWNQMLYYVSSNDFNKLPRSVQEAAILYNNLEKKGIQLPYDQAVRESYDSFNRFVSSHPLRSLKESDYIYSQKFGKTFFYYYYFIRNLQTY